MNQPRAGGPIHAWLKAAVWHPNVQHSDHSAVTLVSKVPRKDRVSVHRGPACLPSLTAMRIGTGSWRLELTDTTMLFFGIGTDQIPRDTPSHSFGRLCVSLDVAGSTIFILGFEQVTQVPTAVSHM